jgi:hypothetical protein
MPFPLATVPFLIKKSNIAIATKSIPTVRERSSPLLPVRAELLEEDDQIDDFAPLDGV